MIPAPCTAIIAPNRRVRSFAPSQAFSGRHLLELHPQKTKIVYCKDSNRPNGYPEQRFDFLGISHAFADRAQLMCDAVNSFGMCASFSAQQKKIRIRLARSCGQFRIGSCTNYHPGMA
jgi:hypothetical protein